MTTVIQTINTSVLASSQKTQGRWHGNKLTIATATRAPNVNALPLRSWLHHCGRTISSWDIVVDHLDIDVCKLSLSLWEMELELVNSDSWVILSSNLVGTEGSISARLSDFRMGTLLVWSQWWFWSLDGFRDGFIERSGWAWTKAFQASQHSKHCKIWLIRESKVGVKSHKSCTSENYK